MYEATKRAMRFAAFGGIFYLPELKNLCSQTKGK